MKIGGAFGAASGTSASDFHGLAYRFEEGVGFRPDRGESWVVAKVGKILHVLYGKAGWLTGLWRSPSGKVFVTDVRNRVYLNPDPRPRAAPWQHFDLRGTLEGVYGIDDEHVYVWGRRGGKPILCAWDGSDWRDMPSPGLIVAMHGPRPDLLVAVGEDGLIARWDGARWSTFPPVAEVTLSGVFVASEDEMMAGSKTRMLLRGSVHGWTKLLEDANLTGAVAYWQDRWWVATGGDDGLCQLDGDTLVSFRKTFRPIRLDARDALICTAMNALVSTADGESFRGSRIEDFLEAKSDPPLWERS